ncbi:hypothetical protein CBS101457_005410 [Exobasidium rhododendri]|nr:hypothetical protein CBS101457_005410 [Exobasidium rhododendri]
MLANSAGPRVVSLTLLAVQNCALGLVLPKSRIPNAAGVRYDAATAVFLVELGKTIISFAILFIQQTSRARKQAWERSVADYVTNTDDIRGALSSSSQAQRPSSINDVSDTKVSLVCSVVTAVKSDIMTRDGIRMIVPASLYVLQNNLLLLAANNLSPTSFQVFSQFKIVTTAIFTVLYLQRRLSLQQWVSIFVLTFGIMIFQSSQSVSKIPKLSSITSPSSVTIGFGLMILACLISGFAGTATEKILKEGKSSIWANNFQISVLSLIPASLPIIYGSLVSYFATDLSASSSSSSSLSLAAAHSPLPSSFHPLEAFNGWTWSVIVLNILGGLLVSMVVKYADSILKAFAASVAVILTFVITFLFLGTKFTMLSLFGAALVVLAVLAYNRGVEVDSKDQPSQYSLLPLAEMDRDEAASEERDANEMREVVTDLPRNLQNTQNDAEQYHSLQNSHKHSPLS